MVNTALAVKVPDSLEKRAGGAVLLKCQPLLHDPQPSKDTLAAPAIIAGDVSVRNPGQLDPALHQAPSLQRQDQQTGHFHITSDDRDHLSNSFHCVVFLLGYHPEPSDPRVEAVVCPAGQS